MASSRIELRSIGVVRSPWKEKKDAPRQSAASDAKGTIELEASAEMRDALSDLETWSHIWVIYSFHERGDHPWSPKVQPPRSDVTRGVLATRSPHRPNPIGMSAVKLDRIDVDGCTLHVTGVDMIDGTPVLDIKPYVPYTDAIDEAGDGWLRADPEAPWTVIFSDDANERIEWLATKGIDLRPPIEASLKLGPEPHAYRRIKKDGEAWVLAIKDWRARFSIEANRTLRVETLRSNWRPDQAEGIARAFLERFT